MAGVGCSVGFADIQTSDNAWKCVAAIQSPTNQMVRVKRIALHGSGIAGDAEPLPVRLTRFTAGTGTGTAVTPQKLNSGLSVTPQTTAKVNYTVRPTEDGSAPYLYPTRTHPQGGKVDEVTFDDVYMKENTQLGLEVFSPSGADAVLFSGHIIFEE